MPYKVDREYNPFGAFATGLAGGYAQGQQSELELRKTMAKEKLKRQLFPEEMELQKAKADYYKGRATGTAPGLFKFSDPALQEKLLDEGYEVGLSSKGEQILKRLGRTDMLDRDLQKAKRGEITFEELKYKYPRHTNTIEKVRTEALPKVSRAKGFKMGTGGLISQIKSFKSPQRAEFKPETLELLKQINNVEDLEELLERRDEAGAAGHDVNAILEYFGLPRDIDPQYVKAYFESLQR